MTISKIEKRKQKILDSLKDKAELSIDKGLVHSSSFKLNKKDRKHSGRFTPEITGKTMKFDEIKMNALEPKEEYDDWMERRDGYRGDSDRTKRIKGKGGSWQDPEEIQRRNKKIEQQILIRKAKKEKKRRKTSTEILEEINKRVEHLNKLKEIRDERKDKGLY